jgi:septal ring factor EnvC (AmiA/AmiB activator)
MTVIETLERFARRGPRALVLAAALAAFAPGVAWAVEAVTLENRRAETVSEYERIVEEATLTERRLAELEAEIATVRKDKASISTALIQTAKTERKLSEDIDEIEERLVGLREQEDGIRLSLNARRGVLAEVLGALQRMGLNPPPAILVKPEDALSSVRSAIVLGAVVPELRAETEILIGDLREMQSVRIAIDAERERLFATVREQAAEKQRLTLLLRERERLLVDSESAQVAEARRAAELAAKAGDLKELIASIEGEIESVREAIETARRADEDRLRREAEAAGEPVPEQYRLLDRPPFQTLAGQVSLPVSGRIVRRFGEGDGIGGHAQGDTVQTQSGTIVTAPADGGILYAGPFRSYGQLLILDAGGGYHVVLAGLGRISVSLGQSVLAGEPVGTMGEARLASAVVLGGEGASPELYVEFRKDGKPVDPAPWWAARSSGRTGNDT